jgi:hypothetical protein
VRFVTPAPATSSADPRPPLAAARDGRPPLSEIEKADLVIAHLTYLRPSVYFEAGFAQRAILVVYTVRSDHFHAQDGDHHGNRQVHFALKMRNIIRWSSPKDRTFPGRLKARIAKVIGPLVRRKNDRRRENALVDAFDKLSQKDKRQFCSCGRASSTFGSAGTG